MRLNWKRYEEGRTPTDLRLDLADDAELAAGIRHAGGEPRALQLYCEKGSRDDVLATWREKAAHVSGRALDCGHGLQEEAPAETAAALLAFLTA